MDADKKRKFIADLCDSVEKQILSKVDLMPEEWDGLELRKYIADQFEQQVYSWKAMPPRRRKDYKNEILIRNL